MKIEIRFFASTREKARMTETEREVPEGATVADLWCRLCEEFPDLEELSPSISFAVNREYAEREQRLEDGDEVALIPPVSGG
jgi:molybdopterin converting factor subunit 1